MSDFRREAARAMDGFMRELREAVCDPTKHNVPERVRVTAEAPKGEVWSLPYAKDDDDLDAKFAAFETTGRRELVMHPDTWADMVSTTPFVGSGVVATGVTEVFGIPVVYER